jgi:putative flippase GtrA
LLTRNLKLPYSFGMYQFLIFAGIGVLNTALDFVLWRIFVKIFDFEISLGKFKLNKFSIAQILSYSCAVFFSYFMNAAFTFKSQGNFLAFLIINLAALGISTFIINYITSNKAKFTKPFPFLEKHFYSIAKLSVVFVTMLVSFFGYKLFVF